MRTIFNAICTKVEAKESNFIQAAPKDVYAHLAARLGIWCAGNYSGIGPSSVFISRKDALAANTFQGRIKEPLLHRFIEAIYTARTLNMFPGKAKQRIFGSGKVNEKLLPAIQHAYENPGNRNLRVIVDLPDSKYRVCKHACTHACMHACILADDSLYLVVVYLPRSL